MEEKFLNLIEESLEKDKNTVKMKDKLRDYEEWDSLAVLAVASMLNKEFDVIISSNDFNKFQTVKDLYIYVMENRGNG